ncbi:hypothetical protein ABTY98_38620 [Streptomyces sp. NPDC096040]|uniref:hypothetical protein n=1 Tax=Streptomyces sp. NPDC096040 TaxID=3155541 RepID=UPI00332C9714
MTAAWFTGDCWRREAADVPVVWVGPIQAEGQHAPLNLCAPCLDAVERRFWQHVMGRGPRPTSAPGCEYNARRPHVPRSTMHPQHGKAAVPVQVVSLSFTGLGIRAHADGRTGREAWRLIRERHPRLALAAGAYALTLGVLAAAAVVRLL